MNPKPAIVFSRSLLQRHYASVQVACQAFDRTFLELVKEAIPLGTALGQFLRLGRGTLEIAYFPRKPKVFGSVVMRVYAAMKKERREGENTGFANQANFQFPKCFQTETIFGRIP